MSDGERDDQATLFPQKAGERLRLARESKGLSLVTVGERTRIQTRYLEAIEQSRYEALPGPTYATGFAKAYARAVGVDEVETARLVRGEAAAVIPPEPRHQPYVTADPKRLPSRGLMIVTAGVALAILIVVSLWLISRRHDASAASDASAPVAESPATRPVPPPTAAPAATTGQVRLTALDRVWLKVYDANKTLYLGTMNAGDGFDVPAGADHPKLDVGRPDKLRVTLNGSALPPLGSGARAIKGIAIDPATLGAHVGAAAPGGGTPEPAPSPSASSSAAPHPRAAATHAPRRTQEDETARANGGTSEPAPAPSSTPAAPVPAPSPAT